MSPNAITNEAQQSAYAKMDLVGDGIWGHGHHFIFCFRDQPMSACGLRELGTPFEQGTFYCALMPILIFILLPCKQTTEKLSYTIFIKNALWGISHIFLYNIRQNSYLCFQDNILAIFIYWSTPVCPPDLSLTTLMPKDLGCVFFQTLHDFASG